MPCAFFTHGIAAVGECTRLETSFGLPFLSSMSCQNGCVEHVHHEGGVDKVVAPGFAFPLKRVENLHLPFRRNLV